MAPLCSDPRQIAINFNPARRQAFLKLVDDITNYMLSHLESSPEDLGPVSANTGSASTSGTNTPLDGSSGAATPRLQDEKQPAPPAAPGSTREPATNRAGGRSAREAARIQNAAIKHMLEWKEEFMPKLAEIANVEDDDKIRAERRKRAEAPEQDEAGGQSTNTGVLLELDDNDNVNLSKSEDFFSLQLLYYPQPTRLTTVPLRDRKEAVSCLLLLLLSTGKYSAHSRTLALYLCSALELPQSFLIREEVEIAQTLIQSSKADDNQKEASMSAEAEAAKRRQNNKVGRYWKVGLASVVGATVIGVTGGLAAPLVAGALGGVLGGIGLGGVASFLGVFWMNGALVGTLFGAFGAKMTGSMMDSYAKEVEDFKFIPLQETLAGSDVTEGSADQQNRRLRITIGINGWLNSKSDVVRPWRVLSTETEAFALRYEMQTLLTVGTAFSDLIKSAAWSTFKSEVIKRTVFATLWAALWPIQLVAAASKIDNPFSRGLNRSRKAGHLLADALINKVQGERPVTLIGYSLGAAAIHACLQSLAERRAFGLIDTVVIIGSPAPAASAHWRTLRTAVSGKIFNVYSENDMILGFVYRVYSLSMGIAGLQPIKDVDGIENLDLSSYVSGHLRYAGLTGEILRKCGFVGVRASDEIEKDEVMVLKDEYAEGHLTESEIRDSSDPNKSQTFKDKLRSMLGNDTPDETDPLHPEMKGQAGPESAQLSRAPAPADHHDDAPIPPLPRRPTQGADEPGPALPERPRRADTAAMPKRKPVPSRSEPAAAAPVDAPRPRTSTSVSSGEGGPAIVMIDNDSP